MICLQRVYFKRFWAFNNKDTFISEKRSRLTSSEASNGFVFFQILRGI